MNALSLNSPASFEVLSMTFKDVIEFHSLNLVKLIQLVDPDFSLTNLISGVRKQIVNEDQLIDLFEGYVIEFIALLAAITLALLVVFVIKS